MKIEIPDYLVEMIREEIDRAARPSPPDETFSSMAGRMAEQSGRRISLLGMVIEHVPQEKKL